LVLSQSSGQIGDRITIARLRLKPNSKGTLFWINEVEQEFPMGNFATDATGNFQKDVTVPPSALGNRQTVKAVLTWPEGPLQVSETLHLTIDKMVETLFLALMATTFAILIAIPLSLLPSRNLMAGNLLRTII
jgi:phosphonate transport system permease protein